MINLRLPVVSATAGEGDDGVVLGRVLQSEVSRVLRNVRVSPDINAVRRDTNASGGFNFVDISTEATSEAANSFQPFGADATFSAGDSLYVANGDQGLHELFFDIDTPGVWTGAGFEVWDSTDGRTANRQRTLVHDNTNGLRAVDGIYGLRLVHEDLHSVAFSPVPGDIEERIWYVIKIPESATGLTTAPLCRRMWFEHDHDETISGETYLDVTAVANGAIDSANFGTESTSFIFPSEGSGQIIVFPDVTYGVDAYIFRRLNGDYNVTLEYLATDGNWKDLTAVVDTTNGYQNGPATLGATAEYRQLRWTPPADWKSMNASYLIEDGNGGTVATPVNGYHIRRLAGTDIPVGPVLTPLTRYRSKTYGNVQTRGILLHKAGGIIGACVQGIGSITTDVTISLINLTTGTSVDIAIPANSIFPLNLSISPLVLKVNDKLGVQHKSGGTITDLVLDLVEV